jgi:hypothetical protein
MYCETALGGPSPPDEVLRYERRLEVLIVKSKRLKFSPNFHPSHLLILPPRQLLFHIFQHAIHYPGIASRPISIGRVELERHCDVAGLGDTVHRRGAEQSDLGILKLCDSNLIAIANARARYMSVPPPLK